MSAPPPLTPQAAFAKMQFRYPWRSYQARILAELETHLEDRKLHIVAAPGAGKTVLGLEIIRRLGLRTLILAPSLLVRDQWVERLRKDFLGGDVADWISTDPTSEAILRVSTYQSIHQNRAKPLPPFALLCLDEAHHLRRSWWQTLTRVTEDHGAITLSLTATPPYDADAHEWANYDALCGPIDAEISVPELVLSGDLCPHQDLVFTAITTQAALYEESRRSEAEVFASLRADPEILAMLAASPWVVESKAHSDKILESAQLFSAMLIYLHDADQALPPYARRLLRIEDAALPTLDWGWMQELFSGLKGQLPRSVISRLKQAGALHNDRLTLPPPKFADRIDILRDDAVRLAASCEIHQIERATRGGDLRMAILVDRIGQSALKLGGEAAGYNAGTLLRALRAQGDHQDLALLTGQVVVLPADLAADLAHQPAPDLPGYAFVSGRDFDRAVARVNEAFETGAVRVIVGTQAFLGQGWDAPSLNSLVLGTNLTSFVSVNQLRGRALRIDRSRPDKSASIWHLAVLPSAQVEGEDIERLERRFACFARLDRATAEIRSYFAPEDSHSAQKIRALAMAGSHAELAEDWRGALHRKDDFQARLVQETTLAREQRHSVILGIGLSLLQKLRLLLGTPPSEEATVRILERMARMVIEALRDLGDIGAGHNPEPRLTMGPQGYQISLQGASRIEESLFHDSLREIFDGVSNPRYLIVVRTGLLRRRAQYFAVPSRFDGHKTRAQIFWRNWQGMIGRGALVYTRTIAGRGVLQAARLRTYRRKSHRNLQWR